jgi:hypothetical protein
MSSRSSFLFSVSDVMNSLNFFNAFSSAKSFEAEKFDFYDLSDSGVVFQSRTRKHKETSMPIIVNFFLFLIEILARHYSTSQSPGILRYIDTMKRHTFLRRHPVVHRGTMPYVLNESYNLAYTIFFMREYEFYFYRIVYLNLQDIYTLNRFIRRDLYGYGVSRYYRRRTNRRFSKRFSLFINRFPYRDFVYRFMRTRYFYNFHQFNRSMRKIYNKVWFEGRPRNVTREDIEFIGDHLGLILGQRFLTYDYLLRFTLSTNQWYNFLSRSFGLVTVHDHLSKSIHSFLPQDRFILKSTFFGNLLIDQ